MPVMVGGLHKDRDPMLRSQSNDEILASARIAFGHIDGVTDIGCLCQRIIQLEHLLGDVRRAGRCDARRAMAMEAHLARLAEVGVDIGEIKWGV